MKTISTSMVTTLSAPRVRDIPPIDTSFIVTDGNENLSTDDGYLMITDN